MLRISHRLGNIHQDSDLAAQVTHWEHAHQLEEVTLNEREAQKSRLRLQTSTGQELGLVLPRGTEITDGDIFAFTDREGGLLVHLALQEVMVLTLPPRIAPGRATPLAGAPGPCAGQPTLAGRERQRGGPGAGQPRPGGDGNRSAYPSSPGSIYGSV